MNGIQHVSIEELKEWSASQRDFDLIDVREVSENQEFNIGGKCIPLSQISRLEGAIQKGKPTVIYCRKGVRSQIAIQRLAQKMDTQFLYNLTNGIEALKP